MVFLEGIHIAHKENKCIIEEIHAYLVEEEVSS